MDPCDSVLGAIDDVLASLSPQAQARINLQVSSDDAATPMPHAMLTTVLRNLLDNALRHTPDTATVDLRLHIEAAGNRAVIAVADRGPGLTAEERAKAGRRFWRGDRGRKGSEGAGLGLSIVHAILARHRGSVRLDARKEGGLSVVFEIETIQGYTGRCPVSPAPE